MTRTMGRIQAYEYWSEQYHSARLLVKTLSNMRSSGSVRPNDRARASRVMVLAVRRQARMLAMAERFEKPVARKGEQAGVGQYQRRQRVKESW